MLIVRPTQSLARRLRITPEASNGKSPSTALTEWYARDFSLGRSQLVLFVNPETCLSVVMKAAPYGTLADRFREYLPRYLHKLGWAEAKETLIPRLAEGTRYFKAQNRSTSGIMTQLVKELECEFEIGRMHPNDTVEMSLRLAETLIGGARPGGYSIPVENFQKAVGLTVTKRSDRTLRIVGGTTFNP